MSDKYQSKKNETTINELLKKVKAKVGMDRNTICLQSVKLVSELLEEKRLEYSITLNKFIIPEIEEKKTASFI
jgi:hypothetical protein